MPDDVGPVTGSAPPGPAGSSAAWDGAVLRVALVGRLAAADIALIADALAVADGRFAVVLDRRLLGAPTAEGRAALESWAAGQLAELVPRIAAWADVYDERRYRSLTRDAPATGHGPGYPQRTFVDVDAAGAWVRELLSAG
ncbi:hypothetical protein GB931_20395 [Modestobacter sp. I12A-02628]|uniref:STAS/SEC14 domain-containing protein n=1 Tax=Goekera deserti TaxID=2497753 RepID=A0A7K3W9N0_9ACTN|nr:hypothetical protein [Goekera deserti]MPR00233.1 hypothetical protein [Goekera deserti]NDI49407.1 hypothetical protein [Goekera deserti]NEL52719.1 hypothetical protein [Goekera deserti]